MFDFMMDTMHLIEDAERYSDTLLCDKFAYKFSKSSKKPTLYSSVYVCMIKGWLDSIPDHDKNDWASYLNDFQQPNGFYVDPIVLNDRYMDGDGWGARHLIPHMIIALTRLGAKPRYEFSFLNKYKNPDEIIKLMDSLDFNKVWLSSNKIMNVAFSMQYARDYMGEPFDDSIDAMQTWLFKRLREDCGMWQNGDIGDVGVLYETIRGAYHIYPIFFYDGIELPYIKKAIPFLTKAQNKQGGFDINLNSTACDDIDAIDPLVRIALENGLNNSRDIKRVLKRARINVLRNRNKDGGFVFSRRDNFCYGEAEEMPILSEESNLFGTWFRLLSLVYIDVFLGKNKINLLNLPSCEMQVRIMGD